MSDLDHSDVFMQYFITADQQRRKRKVFIALIISLSDSDGVMDKTDQWVGVGGVKGEREKEQVKPDC